MTVERLKQLYIEEHEDILTEFSKFLSTLDSVETEFVNKMIDWKFSKDHNLLYQMFNQKIPAYTYRMFIEKLMHFIQYDILDDGGCRIRWVKYKFYLKQTQPEDDTGMDLVDCDPEDEQGYPMVVDHENFTSLEDILKAMKVLEERDKKRSEEFDRLWEDNHNAL
jgi:hypothetical protein